jgi:hypothetical protein
MSDELRQVRELPAEPGKLDCEKLLLAGELESRLESARLEVGSAAYNRAACEEPEHTRPRKLPPFEWACSHQEASGILVLFIAHEYASSGEPEPGMAREDPLGTRERAGRPPGVVVRESDKLGLS